MEIKNGNLYETNYARAAAYFLGTCAKEPEKDDELSAYRLITGLYGAIGRDSSVIGRKALPDVYFAPWEQQSERTKDVKTIRDSIAKIEEIIKALFDTVEMSDLSENGFSLPDNFLSGKKALCKALAAVGCKICTDGEKAEIALPYGKKCADALKRLAATSRRNIIPITDSPIDDKVFLYFSRCVFNPESEWEAEAFDKILCAEGRVISLCRELEKRGYRRIDCREGKKVSLDYVKPHGQGKKKMPVKMSWADKFHSGIEISYEELRLEPCFIWLRIPLYKKVLENADKLPTDVLEFLSANTKNCNGCKYCVQTDKTGARPLAAIDVGKSKKCPMFAAFSMNWREFPSELYDSFLATLDAIDGLSELS